MFTFRRPTDDDVRELIARQAGQPWSYPFVGTTREVIERGSGVIGGSGLSMMDNGSPPMTPDPLTFEPQELPGWQIDHHRVLLGHGERAFAAAREAIRGWKMFPPEMTRLYWSAPKGSGVFGGSGLSMMENVSPPKTPDPLAPQEPGDVVAVLYRARPFCLWMLFPARVVYVIDDPIEMASGVREHPDGAGTSNKPDPIGRLTRPARRARFGFAYGTLPDHPERGEERFLVEWSQADDSVWYDLLAISRPGHWLARVGYLYARYEQAKFRRLSGEAMQRACRCRVHER
jgi:uncharacterized protein (UPF0548 family)